MNKRLLALLLLLIALLLIIFSSSFLLYKPQVTNALATRTKSVSYTQEAEVKMTETSLYHLSETNVAITKTQAALPTSTSIPTSTATSTPPPIVTPCQAQVTANLATLSLYPGAYNGNDLTVTNGNIVNVIGRVKDGGWYLVQHLDGKMMWARSDTIQFSDSGCTLPQQSLAYLLGLINNNSKIVVDETFSGNEYFWNIDGESQSPLITSYNDAYLQINSRNAYAKFLNSDRAILPNEELFTLLMNFERLNVSTDSYVGVRFRSNKINYYELRILPTCALEIYKNEKLLFSQNVLTGRNNCKDELADTLLMQLKPENTLSVSVNGSIPVDIALGEMEMTFPEGIFEISAFRSIVNFYYLVITTP